MRISVQIKWWKSFFLKKRKKSTKPRNEDNKDTGHSEKGAELWVSQTRGYRGNAKGVATIVLHNGGFVQSKGGLGPGCCVCEWVGADGEVWSQRSSREIRPLVRQRDMERRCGGRHTLSPNNRTFGILESKFIRFGNRGNGITAAM